MSVKSFISVAGCGAVTGLAVSCASANIVLLQQPTATFSQSTSGFWPVSNAVDSNLSSGWAIFRSGGGDSTLSETAVFETSSDVGFAGGTILSFSLFSGQNYGNGIHTLGLFRLSVTTDSRATFADGLADAGDVTANWVELIPQDLAALAVDSSNLPTGGDAPTLFTNLPGQPVNSVLAGGSHPEYARYTVSAQTNLTGITGIRLEVLDSNGVSSATDLGLPTGGPGRANHGNFVLFDFRVSATAVPSPGASIAFAVASVTLAFRRRRA
jgi:hypothetical protein